MAEHRARIVYALAIASLVFLLPLTINHFIHGRVLIGVGALVIVLICAVDAVAFYRRRSIPVPLMVVIVPMLPTIVAAGYKQGFGPLLWAYPIVLINFFVARRVMANLMTAALLIAVAPVAVRTAGPDVAVRLLGTLAMVAVFANLMVGVIGNLHGQRTRQAITDPLTGAYNRRYMETRLEEVVERGRRSRAPAALILTDIDHFKDVNDGFGHAAGDEVLCRLVRIVDTEKRQGDLLFRIGGEEFLLLLPDTPEEAAATVAEHLRVTVAATPLLDGWKGTASFGVAGLLAEDSAGSWLGGADKALYAAKSGGRDRVVLRGGAS